MKCPRCVQGVHRGAEVCPHCGFSQSDLDREFEGVPIRARRLEDEAGLMRKQERARVERAMDCFQLRFPQLFVAVRSGCPRECADLRQFGLWVLNRVEFEDRPEDRGNSGGVLLVLDPDRRTAAMVWGYRLDPFFDEDDSFKALSRGHPYWLEGRYAEGLLRAISELQRILKKRAARARRNPKYYERRVGAGFRGMRNGKEDAK